VARKVDNREQEIASFGSGMALPARPDRGLDLVRFLADLQTYTVFTGLDPQLFMAQFVSWEVPSKENNWTGRNIARWRSAHFDRLWRKADTEMDPVKRAALFIKMNDMVVQSAVVIPVTWRNVLHAASNHLAGVEPNSWDSIFGRIAYWHRSTG